MLTTKRLLFSISLVLLVLTATVPLLSAQNLGERAGGLAFNVSLDTTSAPENWTISDGGSSPINFTVQLPIYTPIPYNTTPTVYITPMNGTLQPGEQLVLKVTVHMPSNDAPGLKWDNIAKVIAVPANAGSGATVEAALGKEITIFSKRPPFNPWTTILLLVVVIAVAAVIAYYLYSRGRGRRSAPHRRRRR